MISLKGMTWSDPRGYDPVVAASAEYARLFPSIEISWEKRSLQGFESTPVQEMAQTYDLMVIDHPHVGVSVAQACLLPLDNWLDETVLDALLAETLGKSFVSYAYRGHQWALPIDAAAQVQAWRPDLISEPATEFAQVIELAKQGKVLLPLRSPHLLMSFFTICANLGRPCNTVSGPLVDEKTGLAALELLMNLAQYLDPACRAADPIAILDMLAQGDQFVIAPHTYLYSLYARDNYRDNPIAFADIPACGPFGPLGSTLGGTGIAVSASTDHPKEASRFAGWLASAEIQSGLYAQNNGQPGNAVAWASETVNAPLNNALMQTRMTHEAAWLRPRHAGYMQFQEAGSEILAEALDQKTSPRAALEKLNQQFNESFE